MIINEVDMIIEEVRKIISGIIEVPAEKIKEDASFINEYGMDSLRVLEILANLENKFEIVIDPEKLVSMTNLAEVTKIIEQCLKEKENE